MKIDRVVGMATLMVGALGVAFAWPAEHVVSAQAANDAVVAAAQQRQADLAALDGLLRSTAAQQAERRGVAVSDARRALTLLSDAELADLAARARALHSDPVAGLRHDTEELLYIVLIVLLVVLVLKAVD